MRQLRQARAGQSRDGPGQSWLYSFSASDCREHKKGEDTEQKQEGITVGPARPVGAGASHS